MDQGDGDLMASSMIGDYEVVGSIPDACFERPSALTHANNTSKRLKGNQGTKIHLCGKLSNSLSFRGLIIFVMSQPISLTSSPFSYQGKKFRELNLWHQSNQGFGQVADWTRMSHSGLPGSKTPTSADIRCLEEPCHWQAATTNRGY